MFKSLARCTLAVVLSFAVTTALLAQDSSQKLIVIDAGHGGFDPGAKAVTGMLEKDVTLAFAQQLAETLIGAGAAVELIRGTDTYVSLKERAASADDAALLLSIHTAAAPTASSSGMYIFVPRDHPPSERLAAVLTEHLQDVAAMPIAATRAYDFHVFRGVRCPAVMLELGHLTNADDARVLTDPDFRRQVTAAVVVALQAAGFVPAGE